MGLHTFIGHYQSISPCYHVCIVVTRRRIKSNRRKRELLAAIPNLLAAHRAIGNAIRD